MNNFEEPKDHAIVTKNPDLIEMTLLQFLKITLFERFIMKKQKSYSLNQGKIVEIDPPKYHNLAIILDDEVKEVLRINPSFADILLANPIFVEYTEKDHVHAGRTKYINGEFFTEQSSSSAQTS